MEIAQQNRKKNVFKWRIIIQDKKRNRRFSIFSLFSDVIPCPSKRQKCSDLIFRRAFSQAQKITMRPAPKTKKIKWKKAIPPLVLFVAFAQYSDRSQFATESDRLSELRPSEKSRRQNRGGAPLAVGERVQRGMSIHKEVGPQAAELSLHTQTRVGTHFRTSCSLAGQLRALARPLSAHKAGRIRGRSRERALSPPVQTGALRARRIRLSGAASARR